MAEMVKATLNGQWEMWLPKHRADRPEWYDQGGWEKKRLEVLNAFITQQQDPLVYYVGAEEGEMAALCQMWGAEMVLFEPNPAVWPNIREIWEANHLGTPPVMWVGFAGPSVDETPPDRMAGTGVWTTWPDCAFGPVIHDHGFKELHSQWAYYPTATIDAVVAGSGKVPTLITFDVEGAEWEVMKGAQDTLHMYRPVLVASIHPEFMIQHYNQYSRDFRRWLCEFGYKETIIDYQHELHMLLTPT